MKILIACEESQTVCKAFRAKGHEAYSCDIEEPSGKKPEWHILGDALKIINGNCIFTTMDGQEHHIEKWDLLIAHPPCTYLSSAGNKYFNIEKYGEKAKERLKNREEAFDFFMKFINADCDKICVENPVGYINTHYRKPNQIIHPYYFCNSKEDESYQMKRTCLWLKNLEPLKRTNNFEKPSPIKVRKSGVNVYFVETVSGKGKDRQKIRSKTFPSIANAMAEQWG